MGKRSIFYTGPSSGVPLDNDLLRQYISDSELTVEENGEDVIYVKNGSDSDRDSM